MKLILSQIQHNLKAIQQRVLSTPQRALDRAYEAALAIEMIETCHFNGARISLEATDHSDRVLAYFWAELQKHLNTIRVSLAEFRVSQPFFQSLNSSTSLNHITITVTDENDGSHFTSNTIADKLKHIDQILLRYELTYNFAQEKSTDSSYLNALAVAETSFIERIETISDQTGVFPKSILGVIRQVQDQFDADAEAKVIQTFRSTKTRTAIALRLTLLLVLVPLLTQQVSKTVLVGPIVDLFFQKNPTVLFLNADFKQEALTTLHDFQSTLQFDQLIGITSQLSASEMNQQLQEKAQELATEARHRGANAVKNVFADLFALASFAIVLSTNQRGLSALKSLIDNLVYGLSDSAKAFIIILLTDMFVGYHSPEGWEVLLEGLARHIGLVANHDLVYLFIATIPVIMATVFKFWIFRYLNSISPSAVATYKEMNE